MLRFGGLKYKKLNNAAIPREGQNETTGCTDTTKGDRKMKKPSPTTLTTTTPMQERLHNQLNEAGMKNAPKTLRNAAEPKRARKNLMLLVGGLGSAKSYPDKDSPRSPQAMRSLSPTSNFKQISGKFAIDAKRKINCKTRIYKCIKRILKRNSLGNSAPKENRHRLPALRSSSADYRDIKTLLEKQNGELEYAINLNKCVEKPAFIKKIALNLLQAAVAGHEEEGIRVLQREQLSSETGSIQSELAQAQEYQRLLGECWYHENLPRNHSLGLLVDKLPGSFLVRKSTTQSDCYALSLRVPPGSGPCIAHYLIVRTAGDGYKIKGFQKEFSSLRALIVHHSVMPEGLPVPLAVARPTNLVVKTKFDDDYETVFDLANVVRNQS